MTTEERRIATAALCRLAGVNANTLRTWRAKGVVPPGSRGFHTVGEVIAVCVLAELIRAGVEFRTAVAMMGLVARRKGAVEIRVDVDSIRVRILFAIDATPGVILR